MKPVCCDTSVLYSLYGHDIHSAKAVRLVQNCPQPLTISVFTQFELENSLRFAAWRLVYPPAEVAVSLVKFTQDLNAGSIVIARCKLSEVVSEARRISNRQTISEGHRAMDILHVAVAVYLGASEFFSFDVAQRRLAAAEGMKVGP